MAADMVADMEVDKVADKVADMVADMAAEKEKEKNLQKRSWCMHENEVGVCMNTKLMYVRKQKRSVLARSCLMRSSSLFNDWRTDTQTDKRIPGLG